MRECEQENYIGGVSDPTQPILPADLPLLALRSTIVFPGGRIAVQVASAENLSLLASHPEEGALVLCVLDPEDRDGFEDENDVLKRFFLAAQFLGTFRIVPDLGIFHLLVEEGQAFALVVVVKDTSAARRRAAPGRRACWRCY